MHWRSNVVEVKRFNNRFVLVVVIAFIFITTFPSWSLRTQAMAKRNSSSIFSLSLSVLQKSNETQFVVPRGINEDTEDGQDNPENTCLRMRGNSRIYYPPRPMNPPSPFCHKESTSCCSYAETFVIHRNFLHDVLFSDSDSQSHHNHPHADNGRNALEEKQDIELSPKCIFALEGFHCWPCSSTIAKWLTFDLPYRTMRWTICTSTCHHIFENCKNELRFVSETEEELCDLIEEEIENVTFLVDVIQAEQQPCFDSSLEEIDYGYHDDDDDERPRPGCVISWAVLALVVLLSCGIGSYCRKTSTETQKENQTQQRTTPESIYQLKPLEGQ